MFYPVESLKRGGRFYLCWVADSWPLRFATITHRQLWSQDIRKICDDLLEVMTCESGRTNKRFSLRLSSQLMRGLVRLYQRKVTVFVGDLCMINALVMKSTHKHTHMHETTIPQELPRLVFEEPVDDDRIEERIRNSGNTVAHVQDITLIEPILPENRMLLDDNFGEIHHDPNLLVDRSAEMMLVQDSSAPHHSGLLPDISADKSHDQSHDRSHLAPRHAEMETISEHDISLFRKSVGEALTSGVDFDKEIPEISAIQPPDLHAPTENQKEQTLVVDTTVSKPNDTIQNEKEISLEEIVLEELDEPPAKKRKLKSKLIIDKKTQLSSDFLRSRIDNIRVELRCEDGLNDIVKLYPSSNILLNRAAHCGSGIHSNLGYKLAHMFARNLGTGFRQPVDDVEEAMGRRTRLETIRSRVRSILEKIDEEPEPAGKVIAPIYHEIQDISKEINITSLHIQDELQVAPGREVMDISDLPTQRILRRSQADDNNEPVPKRQRQSGSVSYRQSQQLAVELSNIESNKENMIDFENRQQDAKRLTALLVEAGLADKQGQERPTETEANKVTVTQKSRRNGSDTSETPLGSLDRTKVSLGDSEKTTDSQRFIREEWGTQGTMYKIYRTIKRGVNPLDLHYLIKSGPAIPGHRRFIAARCFSSILKLKQHGFISVTKDSNTNEIKDISLGSKIKQAKRFKAAQCGSGIHSNLGYKLAHMFARNLGTGLRQPVDDVEEAMGRRTRLETIRSRVRSILEKIDEEPEPAGKVIAPIHHEIQDISKEINITSLHIQDELQVAPGREVMDISDLPTQRILRRSQADDNNEPVPKRQRQSGSVSYRQSQQLAVELSNIESNKENMIGFENRQQDAKRLTALLVEAGLADKQGQERPTETEANQVTVTQKSRRNGSDTSETPLGSLDRTKVSLGDSEKTTDSQRFIREEWGTQGTMYKIYRSIKRGVNPLDLHYLIKSGPTIPGHRRFIAARCFSSILKLKQHGFISVTKDSNTNEIKDISLGSKIKQAKRFKAAHCGSGIHSNRGYKLAHMFARNLGTGFRQPVDDVEEAMGRRTRLETIRSRVRSILEKIDEEPEPAGKVIAPIHHEIQDISKEINITSLHIQDELQVAPGREVMDISDLPTQRILRRSQADDNNEPVPKRQRQSGSVSYRQSQQLAVELSNIESNKENMIGFENRQQDAKRLTALLVEAGLADKQGQERPTETEANQVTVTQKSRRNGSDTSETPLGSLDRTKVSLGDSEKTTDSQRFIREEWGTQGTMYKIYRHIKRGVNPLDLNYLIKSGPTIPGHRRFIAARCFSSILKLKQHGFISVTKDSNTNEIKDISLGSKIKQAKRFKAAHCGSGIHSNRGYKLAHMFARNLGTGFRQPVDDVEEAMGRRTRLETIRSRVRSILEKIDEEPEPAGKVIAPIHHEIQDISKEINITSLHIQDELQVAPGREVMDISDLPTQRILRRSQADDNNEPVPKRQRQSGSVSYRQSQQLAVELSNIESNKENMIGFENRQQDAKRLTALLVEAGLADKQGQERPTETEANQVTVTQKSRRNGSDTSETPLGSLDRTKVSLGDSEKTTDSQRFIREEWGTQGTMYKIYRTIKRGVNPLDLHYLIKSGPAIPGHRRFIAARCFSSILKLKQHGFISVTKDSNTNEIKDISLGSKIKQAKRFK